MGADEGTGVDGTNDVAEVGVGVDVGLGVGLGDGVVFGVRGGGIGVGTGDGTGVGIGGGSNTSIEPCLTETSTGLNDSPSATYADTTVRYILFISNMPWRALFRTLKCTVARRPVSVILS